MLFRSAIRCHRIEQDDRCDSVEHAGSPGKRGTAVDYFYKQLKRIVARQELVAAPGCDHATRP